MKKGTKKTEKKKPAINLNLGSFFSIHKLHLDRLNPLVLMAVGAVSLVVLVVLLFAGGTSQQENDAILERAKQSMGQVSNLVQNMRRVLEDEQVQALAEIALDNAEKLDNLEQYISGRVPDLIDIELFSPGLAELRAENLGPSGYAVLDMLWTAAESGMAPVQIHSLGETSYMGITARLGDEENQTGYLMIKVDPKALIATFTSSMSAPGDFALDQVNGRFKTVPLSDLAKPPSSTQRLIWLRIPSSLFRIGVKQGVGATSSMGVLRPVFFFVGILFLTLGIMLKLRPYKPPEQLLEDPEQLESLSEQTNQQHESVTGSSPNSQEPASDDSIEVHPGVELPDIGFNLEKMSMPRKKTLPPVELVESIFRAYDIRGIVGKTLDAEVARRVGQVVGSLTLEQDAGPVIVARDGRDSGPDLIKGMIEGIASTGCDVIDIGAAPTGVLYYAAYELSKGTGVMVTGSHNPPEYNGIKMIIGGITQAGDQITGMYERIKSGNLRVGKGNVSKKKMLKSYRERVAGDIQLKRPLKVVADCGNGIGGVVAADVLRDIGAEVFALFDEVDGTFPNHHPDPSEPKNLVDLIEAVKLMKADIGVAFDGDADRLGVVTSNGDIIYSDRLIMLFAKDVLGRVPSDSTIIYDVKCTGHLQQVIEEAGGKAMMYKTGHSLIKNKMREVDSPFAGEMSGHFFFKERWYGFDCGIYSAARLLEILAEDERDITDVLNELPNSVSTPELKLHMEEGETHAFIDVMREKARFPDAKITTIDGIRADFANGWGLVRASNTTPILVIRFDADSEAELQRIKDLFRQQMLAINNKLKLPF